MTTPNPVQAVDQIDRGIEILEVLWLAMQAKDWHDHTAMENMAGTLLTAISTLKPVREALNSPEVSITI